jgi:hypothetical protein
MTGLTRLKRVGIVASVAWMVGAFLYQRSDDLTRASNMSELAFRACSEQRKTPPTAAQHCLDEASAAYETWLVGSWANAISLALLPIPVGWAVAFAGVSIARWVKAGD